MDINRAIDHIAEIHRHLARTEVYRGYRALPVFLSGLLAFVGAALQPFFIEGKPDLSFVWYWSALAVLSALTATAEILYNYTIRESSTERRRTRTVAMQFFPCVVGGSFITIALVAADPSAVRFLPGIWAVVYGLGIFSARPYFPRMIGIVALGFMLAGAALLLMAGRGSSLHPWAMGLTFGTGQIATGLILYWNLERKNHV